MQNAKKITTTLLCVTFTVLLVAYIGLDLSSAQAENRKTIIETELKPVIKEDMSVLIALEEAFNSAETDQEREAIKAEAQKHLRSPPIAGASDGEYQCLGKKSDLYDAIASMRNLNDTYDIPFVSMGCDGGMLHVQIHQDYSTEENMLKYEKTIRSVVGDEIVIRFSNGGTYYQHATCPGGPLNDCVIIPTAANVPPVVKNTISIESIASLRATLALCSDRSIADNTFVFCMPWYERPYF